MVIAVPLPFRVKRYEEEVRGLELPQDPPRVRPLRDRVTEGGAEAIKDRGLELEIAGRLGLADQYLCAEVVDDMPIIPSEVLDEGGGVRPASQRQGRQIEAGRPSFRTISKSHYGLMVEPKPVQVVEQKVRFLFSETQPLSIDFDKITTGAHPRKRQGRLGTAGQDQFKILGKMINEEDQTLVDLRISDQMVVIKDEHDLAG